MTSDDRSPEAIERNIERERADLADTLESLQNKFSVESIARQVSEQFQKHGGDMGQSVVEAVKRNPIGLALTGIGLAWLMFGGKDASRSNNDYDRYRDDQDRVRDWNTGLENSAEMRSLRSTQGQRDYYSTGQSQSNYPETSRNFGRQMPSWADNTTGHDQAGDGQSSFMKGTGNIGQNISDTVSSASEAVAGAGSNVMGKAADMGHSAVAGAKNLASTSADKVSSLASRLMDGTENLSDEARQRVIAARQRAVEFRDTAMGYGRQGGAKVMDLYDEQPLIAGAVVMAFGAAVAAALPKSQLEDDYLGEQRDRLFEDAEQIFNDEKAKLTNVVKAATDEIKNIAQEVKDDAANAVPSGSVAQAVAEKAKESFNRVAEATEAEAKRQNLGDLTQS